MLHLLYTRPCCSVFVAGLMDVDQILVRRMWAVRHEQLNKGMRPEFEEHVRCLMATGSTARQTRESLILNAGHFLGMYYKCHSNLIAYT